MTQHNTFSDIPDQVCRITANRCKLLDRYILIQTGESEYTALIQDIVSEDVTELVFYGIDGIYTVNTYEGEWDYTVHNEYYCYSNVGLGAALDLPVIPGIQAHAAAVFTVVLMFLLVFKSALFPFRKRK